MEYIIELIFLTAKPVMIGSLIYVAFIGILSALGKKDMLVRKRWFWREAFFALYVFAVLKVTGIVGGTWDFSGNSIGSFNLHFMTNESPRLMVLNFMMFVPLGIFLMALVFKDRDRFIKTSVTGFLFSFCIEMTQLLFVGRLADIDDIVFNTAGCIAGAVIGVIAGNLGIPAAVSIMTLLWSVRYKMITPGDVVLATFGVDNVLQPDVMYAETLGVIFGIISFMVGLKKKSAAGMIIAVLAVGLAIYDGYMKYMM